jgi:hypothetical protein
MKRDGFDVELQPGEYDARVVPIGELGMQAD